MYPDFEYLLEQIFNTDLPAWLGIFKTFGFMVALAFFAAAWTLSKELKRKEEQGLLKPIIKTITVGEAVTTAELIWSGVLGFIIGYKGGGIFSNIREASADPMSFLFTLKGNILIGIIGAALFAYMKYSEKKKQQLPKPEQKQIALHPYQRVFEVVIIAAVAGLAGAKIFNALETWEDFLRDPVASLFSSSGLTFYGGLIMATVALYIYAKKNQIPFKHLCDAAAPGLILAYGIGRLGCQVAGDGDWGIFNAAYITAPDGSLQAATIAEFKMRMQDASSYFIREFGSLDNVPYIHSPAPSWLPDWMYAMNYPHNVNNEGVLLANCTGSYCSVLPASVFPTPLYETVGCTVIFLFLWSIRKKLKYAWQMFGIYLVFNGLERFFIEKIRVNYKYDWGFLHPTQAEIISTCLVLAGIGIFVFAKMRKDKLNKA